MIADRRLCKQTERSFVSLKIREEMDAQFVPIHYAMDIQFVH